MDTTFDQSEPGDEQDPRQAIEEAAILAKLQGLIDQRKNMALRNADADAEARKSVLGEVAATATEAASQTGGRNTRRQILKTADSYVNGDRNVQYGDPKSDFARTAAYWQVYLRGIVEREQGSLVLRPHDIAVMQALLKISRLAWTPAKADHWIDIAGYAACGADCAEDSFGGLQ